jgi:hypothetical protein
MVDIKMSVRALVLLLLWTGFVRADDGDQPRPPGKLHMMKINCATKWTKDRSIKIRPCLYNHQLSIGNIPTHQMSVMKDEMVHIRPHFGFYEPDTQEELPADYQVSLQVDIPAELSQNGQSLGLKIDKTAKELTGISGFMQKIYPNNDGDYFVYITLSHPEGQAGYPAYSEKKRILFKVRGQQVANAYSPYEPFEFFLKMTCRKLKEGRVPLKWCNEKYIDRTSVVSN